MLIRDSNGKIHIISRKACKNEHVYNKKIFDIKYHYTRKYASIIHNFPNSLNTLHNFPKCEINTDAD
jgi:hypothetical protein